MIELQDIAYLRSGTADMKTAIDFATRIVGMELVGQENGTAYLRADQRHHCLAFTEGRSGVLSTGFTVLDEDALEQAETELEQAGLTVRRGSKEGARLRHVTDYLAFDDPFGNRIDLVTGQTTVPGRVNYTRQAGITEFGHLCLDAPDVKEAGRFWTRTFNAKVSDWVRDVACLMRIDPVHHKLAVFQGDKPGLCHINFQVETIDDLMRNWHFLTANGVEIEQGPGRHPQSGAIFLYFKGPEGLTYEYSYNVRRIEEGEKWVPRTFDISQPGAIDMWLGPNARVSTQYQVEPTENPFD
ncbi:Biphenyl-2,3-diol 1,2-dioxygenase [Streptomyces sp. RB5]|uniref:Biphenyl-2,3-diol 1,2-dioxygenase n=1 Tax=Streptomyces smaragdinus TaxID=2585196 RepID=A0A7K0CSW7_9ACTN|nr:VOC family protein [Streptomyces smaragdinus]MQY16576.1 Biphenyl-2,3-diol 1,2-dioxygenase [Streptomyces smaragdinus]